MSGYYLLTWDIDGTKVDIFPGHNLAYVAGCRLVHQDAQLIQNKNRGGTTYSTIYDMLKSVGVDDEVIWQNEGRIIAKIEELMEDYLSDPSHLNVLPGVRQLLERLDDFPHCIHGVYSGSTPGLADIILKSHGIRRYFRLCSFAKGREDTRFDLISRLIGYANEKFKRPKKIILFDDSQTGIQVGKQLGATTIGVATGGHTVEELKSFGADYAFNDLANTNLVINTIFP